MPFQESLKRAVEKSAVHFAITRTFETVIFLNLWWIYANAHFSNEGNLVRDFLPVHKTRPESIMGNFVKTFENIAT